MAQRIEVMQEVKEVTSGSTAFAKDPYRDNLLDAIAEYLCDKGLADEVTRTDALRWKENKLDKDGNPVLTKRGTVSKKACESGVNGVRVVNPDDSTAYVVTITKKDAGDTLDKYKITATYKK